MYVVYIHTLVSIYLYLYIRYICTYLSIYIYIYLYIYIYIRPHTHNLSDVFLSAILIVFTVAHLNLFLKFDYQLLILSFLIKLYSIETLPRKIEKCVHLCVINSSSCRAIRVDIPVNSLAIPPSRLELIFKVFCFDMAQSRMNEAPNETRTHL